MSGWGPVKLGPLGGFLVYTARHGGLRIPPVTDIARLEAGATWTCRDLRGSSTCPAMRRAASRSTSCRGRPVRRRRHDDAGVLTGRPARVLRRSRSRRQRPCRSLELPRRDRGRLAAAGPRPAWTGGVSGGAPPDPRSGLRRRGVAAGERPRAGDRAGAR
jgi:hypothetical protein